ncbi:MAG TPA: outer membrane beta-barrel protein [Xanthobacteraceae bacterium]|nr:outer membrane beta-barrel protein [Xanthobacteraceae bacterium]
MKRLLIAGALAFAAAGQALAADLPAPAPPPQAPAAYVPTVAPVYNWGGIYFGANGGYAFGNSEWSDPNNPVTPNTGDFSTTGFLVGPTVGVNFQTDAFVFGIEGDFDASWLDGKTSNAYCGAAIGFPGGQCETKNTWLGTVRGRIGYAADRVLFYATAGGAFGNIDTGVNGGFVKSTKAGWTAGAGVEVAFADNWTARVEYLFVDLQNATCNAADPCGVNFLTTGLPANQTVKFDANLIRLGVDYKFR